MNPSIEERNSRDDQLSNLAKFEVNANPVLIHGSIGHSALMGLHLPPQERADGTIRDIDIFSVGVSQETLEEAAHNARLTTPSPVDGGLCGLLIREGTRAFVSKADITVELSNPEVFDEITSHEVVGTNGLIIKSFSPIGILAVHSLEPKILRARHLKTDRQLAAWFKTNEVALPKKLKESINEFHRVYKETYPVGTACRQLADLYVSFVPESMRKKFRSQTHKFMRSHAGRVSPFAD
jgi:hypothetical protein